ncbi:MAG TPA: HAMP domain-containing sensor histidine kinase [Pelobium sp.]|nr:HAMP domain-containing sensor histidine kinase [Pelobium sp.]
MKLLNYSAQKSLTFSIILVLLSIPIFYVVLNQLFIHSVDESLEQQATLLPEYTNHIDSEEDLILWKDLDWDVVISPATDKISPKKPYTVEEYSKTNHEFEQYRVLEKKVLLLNREYIIAFKSSLIEKDDLIQAVLGLLVTLLIFLTAGSLYINHYISKKIWTPFRAVLDYLTIYDLDKGDKAWDTKLKITEFNELTASINDLTHRSREAYIAQKEFTENASHELQTPLAIIKSKLELFLQQETLSEEQSLLIDEMNKALSGMEKLNINLLLLVKMDNGQYQLDEEFSVIELVEQSISELSFLSEPTSITIKFKINAKVTLLGNKLLYNQLIRNLLVNAISYSKDASNIEIVLNEKSLQFINSGNPHSFDASQLFRRFSKHDLAKTGNGLGLSISSKITSLHQQSLSYNYADGLHRFTIGF